MVFHLFIHSLIHTLIHSFTSKPTSTINTYFASSKAYGLNLDLLTQQENYISTMWLVRSSYSSK